MSNTKSNTRFSLQIAFYTVFTLLNVIQAANTQLIDDEAYYWVYSKFLDWGYYDHPPMIAILIKMGFAIIQSELGVRLFIIAASTGTVYLLEKIVQPSNQKLFYAIILNIAAINFAGFIAVPDIPLFFFVAVYLFWYQKFLRESNLLNTIGWSIAMALMLYSKYHGVLVIFFTVLSNLKLLTKKHIYIAAIIGTICFIPHLVWQYNHGFPSVYFHLWDRNKEAYRFIFTSDYLFGQLALFGPLLGWLFLYSVFFYKPIAQFEKSVKYIAIGVLGFFLLSTLNGWIEANWTIPAIACAVIIVYAYFENKIKWHKIIYTASILTFLLLLGIRIALLGNWIKSEIPMLLETQGNKEWAKSIQNAAKGKPVVFTNSYQFPSKYWFYSGEPACVINSPSYRQNNFNLWEINNQFLGKSYCYVTPGLNKNADTVLSTPKGETYIQYLDSLAFNGDLLFYIDRTTSNSIKNIITVKGKRYGTNTISLSPEMFFLQIYKNTEEVNLIKCASILTSTNLIQFNFYISTLPSGKYTGRICMNTSIDSVQSLNSNTVEIEIK